MKNISFSIIVAALAVSVPRLTLAFLLGSGVEIPAQVEIAILTSTGIGSGIVLTMGNAMLAHVLATKAHRRGLLWWISGGAWGLLVVGAVILVAPMLVVGVHQSTLAAVLTTPLGEWLWAVCAVAIVEVLVGAAIATRVLMEQDAPIPVQMGPSRWAIVWDALAERMAYAIAPVPHSVTNADFIGSFGSHEVDKLKTPSQPPPAWGRSRDCVDKATVPSPSRGGLGWGSLCQPHEIPLSHFILEETRDLFPEETLNWFSTRPPEPAARNGSSLLTHSEQYGTDTYGTELLGGGFVVTEPFVADPVVIESVNDVSLFSSMHAPSDSPTDPIRESPSEPLADVSFPARTKAEALARTIEYFRHNPQASVAEVAESIGRSESTVRSYLVELEANKRIARDGTMVCVLA